MARDGSGTYSLPESAYVYDTVISETSVNSNLSDIAAALTASIAADGQTTVSANLPMNSKKFTGLTVGTAATDSAHLGQVQAQEYIWCGTMTGTADAGILTPAPAITAYAAGQHFRWVSSANVNTAAMTVAISGLTTKALEFDGAALIAGDHVANKIYEGFYDGTAFQVQRISAVQDIKAQKIQSATLRITNTAGTIQHQWFVDASNSATLPTFVDKFNNATTTLTNTPTGADGSTAMANGGKISNPNTNTFICDTNNFPLPANSIVDAHIVYCSASPASQLFVQPLLESRDVNGTTIKRLELAFVLSTGANFALAANIASGKTIDIKITGYLP